jgi:hypothetical protein
VTWLQLLALITKIALAVADIVRERNLMAAGEAQAVLKALEETNARVAKARAARNAAAAGGMQDDDPYLRD